MIPAFFRDQFSSAAQNRGEAYVAQQRVRVLQHDEIQFVARVRGTSLYDVILRADSQTDTVFGLCTCPHFEGGAACKHLWAALREADKVSFLKGFRHFDLDGDAIDLELDDEDGFDRGPESPLLFDDVGPADPANMASRSGTRGRHRLAPASEHTQPRVRPAPRQPDWLDLLAKVAPAAQLPRLPPSQLWYVVGPAPGTTPSLEVSIVTRERKANGEWGKPRPTSYVAPTDPIDSKILALLRGASYALAGGGIPAHCHVGPHLWDVVLPLMCETGRCSLITPTGEPGPALRWDAGDPWSFELVATLSDRGDDLLLDARLVRGEEEQRLDSAQLLIPGGLIVWADRLSRLDDHKASAWLGLLVQRRPVPIPVADFDRLMTAVAAAPRALPITLPESFTTRRQSGSARPHLQIRASAPHEYAGTQLRAALSFDYGGSSIDAAAVGHGVWLAAQRTLVARDIAGETEARESLQALGVQPARYGFGDGAAFDVKPKELPRIVRELTASGWLVEAEGRVYRRAGSSSMSIRSGIDWFELHGAVEFDGIEVALGEVWHAIARGESMVTLGDGTVGLLPEEWLVRHVVPASAGELQGDHVRFARSQVGLIDAWLDDLPPIDTDVAFEEARAALRDVGEIVPRDAAATFRGQLRPYQRDALGWLAFLERCAFGGCLADDMGLGKTVQVLAHLDARHAQGRQRGPSLVVVPRSLVFNWIDEAARFTPGLRVLDHTGSSRNKGMSALGDADLVIVTYGTLRRDIEWLKDVTFDYIVLDEAHAIKNATSESAKVTRLLNGRCRLALSGTPIQNHLGELWSLFEFLNPGMLGAARAFGRAVGRRDVGDQMRDILARAVRPFVLRRTKEAVAPELPARSEQIVHCAMETAQRKVYEALLSQYRTSVAQRIASSGVAKSRLHVLEALLRLRQAACHPGLVDDRYASGGSAKLEVLLSRLDEMFDEGHRALVFSQFTSLLAYVRTHLKAREIRYAYLDGRTRDREARVRAFQEDDGIRLFLISLKAGGLGLNLTGADYVFLLDPWWNPAVEAQAIDRAHRIGQTRPVVAYRLIARGTIEEKILQLQEQKRELSASIVPTDDGLVKGLSEADLEFLFG